MNWLEKEDIKDGVFIDCEFRPESFLEIRNVHSDPKDENKVIFDLHDWKGNKVLENTREESALVKSSKVLFFEQLQKKIIQTMETDERLIKKYERDAELLKAKKLKLLKKLDDIEKYFEEKKQSAS